MATTTKGKDGSSLGKEKRVISPTKSRATKSGLKQPTAIASIVDRNKAPSTPKKQVPNYLRPTVSSRPESPKSAKKNGPEDTTTPTQNKSFIRRRSFDKPTPPPSRLQTSVLSPGPRERTITVRSASFNSKSATSAPRTIVERTSKTLMSGKQQPLYAKNEKKKITQSVNNASAAPTEDPKNILDTTETETLLSLETQQEDGEYVVRVVEEVVKVEEEIEIEKPSELPEYEINDDEHINNVVISEFIIDNGEDEKLLKPCDDIIPAVLEEIEAINIPIAQIEEAGDESAQEEKTENQNGGEENGSIENHHPAEEGFMSEPKVHEVREDIGGEEGGGATDKDSDSGDHENKNESNTVVVEEKEEGVNGGNEGINLNVEGSSVEEIKPEVVANIIAASSKRQGLGQGIKKDSPANNDVIEETASRLLEKRKNRVRALVGAFETVIDKEASSK